MFHTLLESRAMVVDRNRRWTVVSASVHAAIVTAAVVLTVPLEEEEPVPEQRIHVVRWVAPTPAAPSPETRPTSSTRQFSLTMPVMDIRDLPRFDPPPDFNPGPLSTRDIFPPSPPVTSPGPGQSPPRSVLTADHVDRQVMPHAGNGQPRYPDILRAAFLEGDVVARFVVDTLGRVEPGSIAILAATHSLFAAEVRTWLTRTRYRPAEFEGRVVRQLVEQRIGFALRR